MTKFATKSENGFKNFSFHLALIHDKRLTRGFFKRRLPKLGEGKKGGKDFFR